MTWGSIILYYYVKGYTANQGFGTCGITVLRASQPETNPKPCHSYSGIQPTVEPIVKLHLSVNTLYGRDLSKYAQARGGKGSQPQGSPPHHVTEGSSYMQG